ncbi:MAG: amylo-alpha-1,6-glucosidase, partial [Actinomycetes bacterium]
NDRGERADRGDRGDRGERLERSERAERADRGERSGSYDRSGCRVEVESGTLVFSHRRAGTRRGCRVEFSRPAKVTGRVASFEAIVPAGSAWSVCIQVSPVIEDRVTEPRYRCGQPVERSAPVERLARWRRAAPLVETDHEGLRTVVARSLEDLGALRLFDPDHPSRAVVAAGAPWSMALFGRDALLASLMALPADPDLALGVLQTLARLQGERADPKTEEEPGRILHRLTFGGAASMSLGRDSCYYGTADATPLFVMLLGELRRWGLAREVVDQLLPHADAALSWVEDYGDRDGDGYVEYLRATDRGLANQGWKDSPRAVRYADGRVARAPIALCEVQAYVYGAYLARSHFAREVGDQATAERYGTRAARLKAAFNRDFWLPDRGWFAMGLDADKAPIDALASNMGHCLWTGIVDEDKAAAVAAHLVSPAMFSGWGVRTLASSMPGYNPLSYHCGSVWPHDSAIAAAGLMRYGFVAEAQQVVMALLDAAVGHGGRLPELYSGLDRTDLATVVSYPTSCSPQAWAAAAPLLGLRVLLRLD